MAFKFALFAAVCIAQGFAFNPAIARGNDCNSMEIIIPYEFEKTMSALDGVREEVSMTVMEASAAGNNVGVVIACFRQKARGYVKLGRTLSEMMRSARQEIGNSLKDKAEKYAKRMEGPIKAIAVTLRTAPELVAKHIENKEYLKAFIVMMKARNVVEKNGKLLGQIMREMVSEIPEMADRAEQLAKEISETARTGSESIQDAFRQCIAAGGPKDTLASSEEEDESSEE